MATISMIDFVSFLAKTNEEEDETKGTHTIHLHFNLSEFKIGR